MEMVVILRREEMSIFWWNHFHWLHRESKWQLSVQPATKILSQRQHLYYSGQHSIRFNVYWLVYHWRLWAITWTSNQIVWRNMVAPVYIELTMRLTSWRHQMETLSALLAFCARNSPVSGDFPHNGQWRGTLRFSLICSWINGSVDNHEAGDLRRYRARYDWRHYNG